VYAAAAKRRHAAGRVKQRSGNGNTPTVNARRGALRDRQAREQPRQAVVDFGQRDGHDSLDQKNVCLQTIRFHFTSTQPEELAVSVALQHRFTKDRDVLRPEIELR
jgi:hypothetical protein